MKIFVYGTLKRGYSNHSVMTGAEFIREHTLTGFYLRTNGSFPIMSPSINGDASFVTGEIFEVPNEKIIGLDYFEGEGRMYKRTEVEPGLFAYVGVDDFWKNSNLKLITPKATKQYTF